MTPDRHTRLRDVFMGWSKSLFVTVVRKIGARRFYNTTAEIRREELISELRAELGSKVLSGPFKGTIIPNATTWFDGDAAAKIIGTYESNLFEALQKAVERTPDAVINIGCAEGYYAIGLARLLPRAKIFAFDIDTKAGAVCEQAAEENGVSDRVIVNGLCTTESLSEIAKNFFHPLIFIDCEGSEWDLLNPIEVQGLEYCDIIVETHNFDIPDMAVALENRLSHTHDIQRISQGGRNPNEIRELSRFSELDRWLMVSENRGDIMTWLACWAQSSSQRF